MCVCVCVYERSLGKIIQPGTYADAPADKVCSQFIGVGKCTASFGDSDWAELRSVQHILWGCSLLDPSPLLELPKCLLFRSTRFRELVLLLDSVGREQMYLKCQMPAIAIHAGDNIQVPWSDISRYVVSSCLSDEIRMHDAKALGVFRVYYTLVSTCEFHVQGVRHS